MGWENKNNYIGIKYYNFCKQAATDPLLLNSFKQHPDYTPICSHVSIEEGKLYYDKIKNISSDLILEFILANDSEGGAPLYIIGNEFTVPVDPTSLRYLKFTSDIKELFGENLGSVLEIGGGYGGLCLCINSILSPDTYDIKDHEDVMPFVNSYLKLYSLKLESKETYDTVISTYAWDELDFPLREEYTEYFNSSKQGYLIGKTSKVFEHIWPTDVTIVNDEITKDYSVVTWKR